MGLLSPQGTRGMSRQGYGAQAGEQCWCRSLRVPRRLLLGGLVLVTAMVGAGCTSMDGAATLPDEAATSSPTETESSQPAPPNSTPSTAMPSLTGQQLPITAMATIGDQDIFLEVASTPRQQALGLMFRDPLPDYHGMLFPMGRPRPVSFWMKNVPGPLDMVFIYDGVVQHIAADVPPCTADPCPTYGPGSQLVDAVIELRGGHAAELGLAVGDSVVISPVEADSGQAE